MNSSLGITLIRVGRVGIGAVLGLLFLMGAEPPHVATTPHRAPEQERATFKVPDGFEVQLVAAEPDINKPINMAFDAKGRLWVTSTVEYPYPAKDRPGNDCVKVLSDFGPDGRARKVETFAGELNIPIGILPYQDGAIVYSIPNIWFLRDTDGDGQCDQREVLYSGFGHKDTHGMVNGFFMGFDGWVYACHGYANDSTVRGRDGHEIKMNSGNVFRFKPDGSRVELFAQGQVNPFGSCMDKWGNLYTACCHSKPISLVMRGAVYESFSKPHDGLGFAPAMVHNYRGSTALCGLAWYEADYFPKEYQENFYLGDVVNNCVNRFTVTWKGATPTAHQQADFLTSTDPWFRPCDIKLGPDGALYIADFYNRIIGHYEVPLNHPGRDRTSGRIWRVVRKDQPVDKVPDRTTASLPELAKELDSKNIVARMAALHLLASQKNDLKQFLKLEANGSLVRINPLYLWAMARANGSASISDLVRRLLNQLNGNSELEELLSVHTMGVLFNFGELVQPDDYKFLQARSPKIQRAVAEMLARFAADRAINPEQAADMLIGVAPTTNGDPVLHHSFRIALRNIVAKHSTSTELNQGSHGNKFLAEVALGIRSPRGAELIMYLTKNSSGLEITPEMIVHAIRYANCDEAKMASFLEKVQARHPFSPIKQVVFARAVVDGFNLRGESTLTPLQPWLAQVALAALAHNDRTMKLQGMAIAKSCDSTEILGPIKQLAADLTKDQELRLEAWNVLAVKDFTFVVGALRNAAESGAIREAAGKALAGVNQPAARDALVAALPTAPSKLAATIAQGLAGSKQSAEQMCLVVEKGQASPRLLADRTVRQKLEAHGLKDRVDQLTHGLPPMDKQVEELIAKKRDQFQKASPNVSAGKELFTKHCAVCHQVGGQGAKVGPQLDGIDVRGLDRLLEDTLDPSRNVDPTFRMTNLQLSDGRALSGLFLREEGASLIFADNQGKEFTVKKDQIEQRTVSPLSAMPTNVAESLKDDEFAALLAYLLSLKK